MWTVRPGAPQGSTLPRESSLLPSSGSTISRFSLMSFSVKHLTPILHCAWNPWVQTLSLNFPQNTLLSLITLDKKKVAWLLPFGGRHVAWVFADPQCFKQSLLFHISCLHFYKVFQIPYAYRNSVWESSWQWKSGLLLQNVFFCIQTIIFNSQNVFWVCPLLCICSNNASVKGTISSHLYYLDVLTALAAHCPQN